MGIIKTAKANLIVEAAAKARDAGRRVFVAQMRSPLTKTEAWSGGIDDWSQMVDAVEAQGWRLDRWAVTLDAKGRPAAYPLFRRA